MHSPPSPTNSAPSSPTYKRRRTDLHISEENENEQCLSPASTLRKAVRLALAQESSPRARSNRLNQVYDTYRKKALESSTRNKRFDLFEDDNNNNNNNNRNQGECANDNHNHQHHQHHHHQQCHETCDTNNNNNNNNSKKEQEKEKESNAVKIFKPGEFPGKGAPAGCEHYKRNCWIKAACCNKYYPCRRCHDENETHEIDRHATEYVGCVKCGEKDQKISNECIKCKNKFAKYFCSICKFYDDRDKHDAYHCKDCGICRVGKGIGIDNYHCNSCGVCIPIEKKDSHPCREKSLHVNCPICKEYLATSTTQVTFLKCGHCMHNDCLLEHTKTNYTCPICSKCVTDMTAWFRDLDRRLSQEQMPPEYANRISHIFCNDCEIKSDAPFHFIYHKCYKCQGYNTVVLKQFDRPPPRSTSASPTAATNSINNGMEVFLQVGGPDTTTT